jgi:hypothetical protein
MLTDGPALVLDCYSANPATPMLAGIVCGSAIAFAWTVCLIYWYINRKREREEEELRKSGDLSKVEAGGITREKAKRRRQEGETRGRTKERRMKRERQKQLKRQKKIATTTAMLPAAPPPSSSTEKHSNGSPTMEESSEKHEKHFHGPFHHHKHER